MEPEIIAATIGAFGVVIAAIAAGIISTRRTSDQNPASAVQSPDSGPGNPHAKYVGKLVDFVSGVSDDSPLKVEVAVNDDGRIIVFHNKDWSVNLSHVEFFRDNRRLNFVSGSGESRTFGFPLDVSVAKHLTDDITEVTLVRIGVDNTDIRSTSKENLKIYD